MQIKPALLAFKCSFLICYLDHWHWFSSKNPHHFSPLLLISCHILAFNNLILSSAINWVMLVSLSLQLTRAVMLYSVIYLSPCLSVPPHPVWILLPVFSVPLPPQHPPARSSLGRKMFVHHSSISLQTHVGRGVISLYSAAVINTFNQQQLFSTLFKCSIQF